VYSTDRGKLSFLKGAIKRKDNVCWEREDGEGGEARTRDAAAAAAPKTKAQRVGEESATRRGKHQ